MVFPELIEGVGNEVLLCAISLGGMLFCVALRLYNYGIHTRLTNDVVEASSTNSNAVDPENHDPSDVVEDTSSFYTGVLDTVVMENLRDPNRSMDTGASYEAGTSQETSDKVDIEKRRLEEIRAQGNIVLRLQYLDDRLRYVHAPPDMPVILFKRQFFADEIEHQSKSVRLIFQGRELSSAAAASRDSPSRRRLCDYGVSDSSTIHCLISNAPPPASNHPADATSNTATASIRPNFTGAPDDIDLGTHALMPLFAFMLTSVWLFRFTHSDYFSLMSTLALIFLSAVFGWAAWSMVNMTTGGGNGMRRRGAVGVGFGGAAAGDNRR